MAGRRGAVAGSAHALRLSLCLRLVPTAVLVACVWALAWDTGGSIDAADWLPYAVGAALVLATVLLSGAGARPGWTSLSAGGLLLGLACWTAISLDWSPVPSLARDEALLVALYAMTFVIPLVTLSGRRERLLAMSLVVGGVVSLAISTVVDLHLSGHPGQLFLTRRLNFPVTYFNGAAALFVIGFWPAIGLAAERRLFVPLRVGSLAGATVLLACWLMTQSKGGGIGLVLSGGVFLACARGRLRALVPVLLAAALVAPGAVALTRPWRVFGTQLIPAIRHSGNVALVILAVAVPVGIAYAFVDRHRQLGERARHRFSLLVASSALAAVVSGAVLFLTTVGSTTQFFARQWTAFQHEPTQPVGTTHLFSVGSDRYDYWRVAILEFRRHPVAGIGARGFGPAYLMERRGAGTAVRAHSLELDVLSETGIVGLLLLLGAGSFLIAALWPGARLSLPGAGLLAAGVYFAVHTAVDWVWTIPPVGMVAFTFAGIGASFSNRGPLRPGVAIPAGVAALALALVAFAPPWLSARFVDRAYQATSAPAARSDLRWARRLDPLSIDPYVAEAELASSPADIPPLERAVAKEPRLEDLRYLLGTAYLRAGRKAQARAQLREALRLFPDDVLAKDELRKAR
jgi:O-Antigen ligase